MNPIKLSLLQEQLEGVAEVMGSALSRSAFSPNIRVRLDFSCALFNARGELLAQAAHIPVHLGSMPDQIKRLVQSQELSAGDIFIANDPYDGGTHLPDITLMEPVFDQEICLGVVAARAHHADVGGVTPGSMSSQPNIYGDGIRIPILRIARNGEWDPNLLNLLFANMRSPVDREGDLMAQLAALHHGKMGLQRVFRDWADSRESLWADGQAQLFLVSRSGARAALTDLFRHAQAKAEWEDQLEVGTHLAAIRVRLSLTQSGDLLADFEGTSNVVTAGFNATLPVTKAAVCYVVRCLTPHKLPLNQGFLDCIVVRAPKGSLVAAHYPQAVAAGNVETSQRIVDVVFGAFSCVVPERVPAASAGTMNNFSFGFTDPRYGVHYETSGGGAGGCPGGPWESCSAVQVHMTNTLSTPIEVLEEEFPVVVRRHAVRKGSGGAGVHSGGHGTIKELTFRKDAEVTFMATRRDTAPFGLQGGESGEPGWQAVMREGAKWEPVRGSSTHSLPAGSSVLLKTPGGGGWGKGVDADIEP
jgi:N-methylhydantoinase B